MLKKTNIISTVSENDILNFKTLISRVNSSIKENVDIFTNVFLKLYGFYYYQVSWSRWKIYYKKIKKSLYNQSGKSKG